MLIKPNEFISNKRILFLSVDVINEALSIRVEDSIDNLESIIMAKKNDH